MAKQTTTQSEPLVANLNPILGMADYKDFAHTALKEEHKATKGKMTAQSLMAAAILGFVDKSNAPGVSLTALAKLATTKAERSNPVIQKCIELALGERPDFTSLFKATDKSKEREQIVADRKAWMVNDQFVRNSINFAAYLAKDNYTVASFDTANRVFKIAVRHIMPKGATAISPSIKDPDTFIPLDGRIYRALTPGSETKEILVIASREGLVKSFNERHGSSKGRKGKGAKGPDSNPTRKPITLLFTDYNAGVSNLLAIKQFVMGDVTTPLIEGKEKIPDQDFLNLQKMQNEARVMLEQLDKAVAHQTALRNRVNGNGQQSKPADQKVA